MYGSEDGAVPATFEILYMIGWKPHESQVSVRGEVKNPAHIRARLWPQKMFDPLWASWSGGTEPHFIDSPVDPQVDVLALEKPNEGHGGRGDLLRG